MRLGSNQVAKSEVGKWERSMFSFQTQQIPCWIPLGMGRLCVYDIYYLGC